MRPHVGAEVLARFRQGDLSQSRRARISAHLARCARCSSLNEDLAGVTTLLASVTAPPMPDHLTGRIQTALATEAARRAVPPASETAAGRSAGAADSAGPATADRAELPPGRPAPRERPERGWRPRLPALSPRVALGGLAAAAAVVLVAVGVYQVSNQGASSSRSPGSAAAPAAGKAQRNGILAPARGPALEYRHGGRQVSITPITTDTDFTPGKLSSQVAAQVARYGSRSTQSGPMSTPATSGTRSNAAVPGGRASTFGKVPVAALEGCVNRIAAGELVVLVEVARYQGSPATIIVTELSAGSPGQAWVVGSACSASVSDVLQHAELSPAG
ncbi:MAG TPA: hypothetical protein VMI33_18490 [Streptosporangiaceae bacterium]|nr:hypothetical protein [Streptosporangiaceae bacterium]